MSETEDLKARIESLEKLLTPDPEKESTMRLKNSTKALLNSYRDEGKKESFDDLIWKMDKRIKELEEENFELNSDVYNLKTGRSTLSEFKEKMKESNVNCTVSLKYIGSKAVNEEQENGGLNND
jgi:hypothetical protein